MPKGRVTLAVAALLGLGAGLAAWSATRAEQADIRARWKPTQVLVADVDLAAGAVLEVDQVAVRQIPERFVTPSVVRPDGARHVLGQVLRVPLHRGDPLLWTHFEGVREPASLSALVRKRGRAVSVPVDPARAVGSWVRPNDHVDVLGTFRDPRTGEALTVTLLQNVVVLATGDRTALTPPDAAGGHGYRTVSLLVLPEEAELLALGVELGTLTLTLRHPEDLDLQASRGQATLRTLVSGERMQALERRRLETIEVIRGRTRREVSAGAGP